MAGNRHRGDEAGAIRNMESVIAEYSDMVYRLAYAMMKNKSDADDIYQEVFLRYIRRRPIFHSSEHARAWMLKVTANCCKNHWKSPWADGRMEPLERQDVKGNSYDILEKQDMKKMRESGMAGADPAQQCWQRWQREELRCRIGELPERYRLVIHLYYYEELSTEEIARLLHRRTSTVRTQLVRARQQLRNILEQCGYAEAIDLD